MVRGFLVGRHSGLPPDLDLIDVLGLHIEGDDLNLDALLAKQCR